MYTKFLCVALLLTLFGCKNDKIKKNYSKNRVFAKKIYYNNLDKIDSIDYLYNEILYARYIAKDSQVFGYNKIDVDSMKNIDEIPNIEVEETEKTYKVNVKFESTSYIIWKFIVTKGSKMINYGGNFELNSRFFEIPKESSNFNFMIKNSEKSYSYNISQFLKNNRR